MLTPQNQRAARALLGWGVRDLAQSAGLAWTTVSQFENGRNLRAVSRSKIIAAFAAHGVELVDEKGRHGAFLMRARA